MDLAQTIKKFQISGFPLTIAKVYQLAYQFTYVNGIKGFSDDTQQVGRKWLRGFLKRHPDIKLKTAKNLSIAQAMGANPTVIQKWFDLLENIKSTKGIHTLVRYGPGTKRGCRMSPKRRRC